MNSGRLVIYYCGSVCSVVKICYCNTAGMNKRIDIRL